MPALRRRFAALTPYAGAESAPNGSTDDKEDKNMTRCTYYIKTTDGRKRSFLEAYGEPAYWLNGLVLKLDDSKDTWEVVVRIEELDDGEDSREETGEQVKLPY